MLAQYAMAGHVSSARRVSSSVTATDLSSGCVAGLFSYSDNSNPHLTDGPLLPTLQGNEDLIKSEEPCIQNSTA